MKTIFCSFALLFLGIGTFAQESNNKHKSYLEIGYSGGTNSMGGAGGVYGALGIFFKLFNRPSSLSIRTEELYVASPEREAGAISLTYRCFLTRGWYLGAGFAHNHETPFDKYLEEPVGAMMGNSRWIIHRTGVAAEIGYDFKGMIRGNHWLGIYPVINLTAAQMLNDEESQPNPLVTLSFGFRFGFSQLNSK